MTAAPSVHAGMPAAEYFALPGLSNSGMKDLAVSPLRYWHLHVNPNRPAERETPEMRFGSALHCAVLESTQFDRRYCRELDVNDYPGCLTTIESIRVWINSKGGTPKGTRKAELIAQALKHDPNVPILDVLEEAHAKVNANKILLSGDDWQRVTNAGIALLREPQIQRLLVNGERERSVFAADPNTGVPYKARMDCVSSAILDIKTFTQQRGKSIDKSVADAMYYEQYLRQGYFYCLVDSLAHPTEPRRPFVLAFVESDEPHEVRIRELAPKTGSEPNLYWLKSQLEVRTLTRTYAECWNRYGEEPWRSEREIDPLCDEEIPQLAY